jgi:squalene-hopene/tetraprenyl-beta-curcumene cyclase
MAIRVEPRIETAATQALERARDHLLSLQSPAGWWKGELETNVTMDAEDLLLRKFLEVLTEDVARESAEWIRSQQRDDGTWANFFGGPGDLSTTVESYVALKLAGDPTDAAHMRQARQWVLDRGGLERTRVFTRLWMALFGLWSWEDLPALPPELIFAPEWFPFNVYDWACWARQTIVPLTVVGSFRPVRPIGFGIDELRSGLPKPPRHPLSTWKGRFEAIDQALHAYERHPNRRLRQAARRKAGEWIIRRQEADGGWGGIQPPWVYSMMALNLMGYPIDHPVIRAAFDGLDGFTIRDERGRRLEACQSPVWDTALAVIGLSDAGLPGDDHALLRAADWLLDEEIGVKGDWSVRRPGLEPGGWAFEFANDNYPDIDDTAEVVMALRRVDHPDSRRLEAAIERGVRWTSGMQSSDGGWGAFDADNTRELAYELPFCDFGAVIDPPSADVTAHVVEMLAGEGRSSERAARRGLGWLARAQESDGSWFGRWGANFVYGTGAVVPGAIAAGVSPHDARIRRAITWLEAHQNPDGGWGEDLRSYDDPARRGRGTSTASQTAWALLALLAGGQRPSQAVERGVAFLAEKQTTEGTWDEPFYTGTGFPGDFYINYHLYRLAFPIQALGRFVHGARREVAG